MDSDRVPRALNCGHTFCHSCLKQCLRNDGIPCPFCSAITSVTFGDVSRIPINYSILDMLAIENKPDEEEDVDMCEVCNKVPPTIICVSCSPMGVKFCHDCDKREHNRSFKPVQLHKRIPLKDFDFSIMCSRHNGTVATHYSEGLNQFACLQCQGEFDWGSRSQNFLLVTDAAEVLRIRAAKYNYSCGVTMKHLHDMQKELDSTLVKLVNSASEAKIAITSEFQRLVNALQLRQQKLLKRVEEEVRMRYISLACCGLSIFSFLICLCLVHLYSLTLSLCLNISYNLRQNIFIDYITDSLSPLISTVS